MRHKRGSVLGSGAPPVYRNSRDSPLEERVKSEPVSENGTIPDDSER